MQDRGPGSMDGLLAKGDDTFAIFVALGVVVIVLGAVVVVHAREWMFPRTIIGRVRRFLGRKLRGKLEGHQKSFPGYDLASVNLALQDFFKQRYARVETLGSYDPGVLRDLLERDEGGNTYQAKMKVSAPAYQRLAVDVDQEQSFAGNCLYCCTLVGDGGRVVLLLSTQPGAADYDEDMEARGSPAAVVNLMIGCAARPAA